MATLNEHKEQIKSDNPEGSIYHDNNGTREALTGDDYELWLTYSAEAAKNKEDNQYKEDRKKAYASIEEQLDMMYWDKVNGTTTWKDHIAEVKADNPKP